MEIIEGERQKVKELQSLQPPKEILGRFTPDYCKPSDVLAVANATRQREKAAFCDKDGLVALWLPGEDLNLE